MSEISYEAGVWYEHDGSPNPVPGQRVERKERSGDLVWCACLSDDLRWSHSGWDTDIIAFRLAPPAPVEASGSDWKQAASGKRLVANLASYCGGETPGCTDISPCCECLKQANVFERGTDAFGMYVAQLGDLPRPQPSGETREEIEAVLDRLNNENVRYMARVGGLSPWIETFKSDLRALLSARPLALGGQQGVDRGRVEAIVREAVIAASVDVPDKFADRAAMRFEITQNATDAIVSALSTTPARAEAQDEGAAGESLDDVARRLFAAQYPGRDYDDLKDMVQIGWLRKAHDEILSARANPSPTPAADADRGMKAFNFINDLYRIKAEFPAIRLHGALKKAEALAALKSTAAKEGGE